MKRLAVLTLLVASGLMAQEGQNWGTVQITGAQFGKDSYWKRQVGVGLDAGTWFGKRFGGELRGTYLPLDTGTGIKSKEVHLLGSVLYNLRPGATNWYPYLAAGPGATYVASGFVVGDEANFNLHAGVGLFAHLKKNIILQADAKALRVVTGGNRWEGLLSLGIGCVWGAPAAKPTPAPAPAPVAAPAPPPPPPPPPAPVVEAPKAPEPPPAPAPVVEVAKPVAPPPPPPPPPAPPKKIVLDEAVLHFPNGKNDLSADGIAAIKKVAESLKGYQGEYTLLISGHTSSLGKPAFNKALSKRRADAVAKILVSAGIPAAAIKTVGTGPDKPLADNKTKEGQAKNRRVEIDIQTQGAGVETRRVETSTHL